MYEIKIIGGTGVFEDTADDFKNAFKKVKEVLDNEEYQVENNTITELSIEKQSD